MTNEYPASKRMKRHGTRWALINIEIVRMLKYRNKVEDRISFEKLVAGAIVLTIESCKLEKSAILF